MSTIMSTIDKKMLGITEVVTPENLDERVISRYVTQVCLGSKLKETSGTESEPVEVPEVSESEPVEVLEQTEITESPVETITEDPVEDKTDPEPEIIEIPKTPEDEEIAVDEETV